ncbi:MAG: hypothetical protein R3F59_07345 [Myxococcota bacterium]
MKRAGGLALLAFAAAVIAAPERGDAAPGSQEFEEFVVVGEVLKPEITVVISRENLNKAYELKLDESFLDKIVESVSHPPF